jgi:hypothetical protein
MRKIDSRQHFWCFDPVKDEWITTNEEQSVFWSDNAIQIYKLN